MRKDSKYVVEDFNKTLIYKGLPMKRDKQNENEKNYFLRENEPTIETPKRRRGEQTDYRETYFEKVEMTERKSLYITRATHLTLWNVLNMIDGHKATNSGFVESMIRQHLESHKEEINSLYENQFKKPIY